VPEPVSRVLPVFGRMVCCLPLFAAVSCSQSQAASEKANVAANLSGSENSARANFVGELLQPSRAPSSSAEEYGSERAFNGRIVLAQERVTFIIDDPGELSGTEVWLDTSRTPFEYCLAFRADGNAQPVEHKAVVSGRLSNGSRGPYGHLGLYPEQIRVTTISKGNPC